ncbi:MAG: hypothetical protein ACJ8C4_13240 [Gemmataceae bacterium]
MSSTGFEATPLLRSCRFSIGFFTLLIAAFCALAVDEDLDAKLLTNSGIVPDPASLCTYVRRLAPSSVDEALIARLIEQLGDSAFEVRERATQQLVAQGPKALPALRAALENVDAEATHRAQRCLRRIERENREDLVCAAIRVLGRSAHEDAPSTLLTVIPSASEPIADEIRDALSNVVHADRPIPHAIELTLTDANTSRRIAAAEAVAISGGTQHRGAVRPLLSDSSASVRFRVGMAFAKARDRDGVPAVIAALSELSANELLDADDFLNRLATDNGPNIEPALANRREYSDAWRAWWTNNGATAELANVSGTGRIETLLAAVGGDDGGSILEIPYGKTATAQLHVRRRIDDLRYPVAVAALPRGRVLVCELRGNTVTERDLASVNQGKTYWQRAIVNPVAVQRLPGGGIFIAGRNEIVRLNRDRSVRYRFDTSNVAGAVCRRDGSIVVVTNIGIVRTLNEAGVVTSAFPITRTLMTATVQDLPGGRLLIPLFSEDRVVEYDLAGNVLWSAKFRRPNAAYRLPNGRTIVSCHMDARAAEIDRLGNVVREYVPGSGLRPYQIVPGR